MSALIIQSHVKEGVELAREYGVPDTVLDFIPQHHGTTRISFFYDKALRQAVRRPGKDVISESDFRYPGPKPQTKEAGIVMLADSVEASTRSIPDMTPQRLELMVENMIKHRFIEGELDECELTLRDLTKIKETFFKILMGIYHQRIKYPEQTAEEAQPPITDGRQGLEPSVQPRAQRAPSIELEQNDGKESVAVSSRDPDRNRSDGNPKQLDGMASEEALPQQNIPPRNP